jgi:hypothetical protein
VTSSGQPVLFLIGECSPSPGHVKTSVWRDAVRAWVAHVRDCSGTQCGWPTNCPHAGAWLRTCQVCSHPSVSAPVTEPAWITGELFDADGGIVPDGGTLAEDNPTEYREVLAGVAACAPTGEPWVPSSGRWGNTGWGSRSEFWTRSGSVYRSDASVSSLSGILETGPHLSKYCLSPRAARGILRRAAGRGRELPAHLKEALEFLARSDPMSSPDQIAT